MKQIHIMYTPQEIVESLVDINKEIAKAFNTPCNRENEHLRQSYVSNLRRHQAYLTGMLIGMNVS